MFYVLGHDGRTESRGGHGGQVTHGGAPGQTGKDGSSVASARMLVIFHVKKTRFQEIQNKVVFPGQCD